MKTITLTLILTTISLGLFSQNFEIPKNYTLDKAEDYAPYEQDVVKCFDWLMKTPINEQTSKRKEANVFLLKWVSGSPNVFIEIKEGIVTFVGTSPDLLMVFMGGWAKYSLDTKKFNDKLGGTKAGIESVIKFYIDNKEVLPTDKNIEKYIKMKEKGTLNEYLENNV